MMTIREAIEWCVKEHAHVRFSEYAVPSMDEDFGGAISYDAPAISICSEYGDEYAHSVHKYDEAIPAFIEAVERAKAKAGE